VTIEHNLVNEYVINGQWIRD